MSFRHAACAAFIGLVVFAPFPSGAVEPYKPTVRYQNPQPQPDDRREEMSAPARKVLRKSVGWLIAAGVAGLWGITRKRGGAEE